jgi:hypothetical protein
MHACIGAVYWSNSMVSSIHVDRLRRGQRLVVREEIAGLREVRLGLLVVAAVNGVVGPLEESVFAVLDELDGGRGKAGGRLGSWWEGTTTEAVMSSSCWTLMAGMKSLRRPKVRQAPSGR